MSDSIDKEEEGNGAEFNSGIIRKTEYFDLFISYKRDNGGDHGQKLAEELYEKLTKDGYKVWLDNQEIGYSNDFEQRIEEAIVHSKKFLCVLGPGWVNSPNCRLESKKAVDFQKRIIPVYYQEFRKLFEEKKAEGVITEQEWRRVDKPQEVNFGSAANHKKSYEALKALCDLKDDITIQHTKILCESYYWGKYRQPKSMLYTGTELSKVKLLQLKCDSDDELPSFTPIQLDLVKASEKFVSTEVSNKRKVFITFSPKEIEFASELNMELRLNNISTWFDSELLATDSEQAFIQPIINCENVLDICTSGTTSSEDDLRMAFARSNSKRVIQVTNSKTILSERKDRGEKNIFLWNENVSIDSLITTINGDSVYNGVHSMLLSKAFEWEKSEKSTAKLLPFKEAEAGQVWYQEAEKAGTEPKPNLDMINFVERSLTYAETVRKRKRLAIWSVIFGIVILLVFVVATIVLEKQMSNAENETNKSIAAKKTADKRAAFADKAAKKAESDKIAFEKEAEAVRVEAENEAKKAADRLKEANDNIKATKDNLILAEVEMVKAKANAEKQTKLAEGKKIELDTAFAQIDRARDEMGRVNAKLAEVKRMAKKLRDENDADIYALSAIQLFNTGQIDSARSHANESFNLLSSEIDDDVVVKQRQSLYNAYSAMLSDTSVLSTGPRNDYFEFVDEEINDRFNDPTLWQKLNNQNNYSYFDGVKVYHAYEAVETKSVNNILGKVKDKDSISVICTSKANDILVMGYKTGAIHLWELKSGSRIGTYEQITTKITSIAISPSAKYLVIGDINDRLNIVSYSDSGILRNNEDNMIVRDNGSRINEVYFLDDDVVITVTWDLKTSVWVTNIGKLNEEINIENN